MAFRSVSHRRSRLGALAFLLSFCCGARPVTASPQDPLALARALADLGPRPMGSEAHARAAALLLEAMRGAGLERVEVLEVPGSPPLRNLTGVVAGQTEDEILLAAHYDSVAASPGAGDDASGCAAVLAAAAELRRTPLRHTVRVLLFDGEEEGLRGSRAWAERLEPDRRDRVLAGLVVEMVGWGGSAGPTLHILPARRPRRWAVAPGWLVHAALRGGDAGGWRLAAGDPRLSAAAQLLVRSVAPHHSSDADALLEAGIPAVLLSDSSLTSFDPAYHQPFDRGDRLDGARLARWVNVLAAAARRLDALEGRPVYEDRFLVLGGRVWQRRELYWAGFALWVALVVRTRLERRRRSGGETSHHSSLPGLVPGLLFRLLFLVATLALPVFSALLLFPAAVLALLAPRRRGPRRALQAAGLLPLGAFLGVVALAVQGGFVAGWTLGIPAVALLLGTLAAYVWSLAPAAPGAT
jgi:hypothetical protein